MLPGGAGATAISLGGDQKGSELGGQVTGDERQVNDVDLRCQGIGVRGCLCRGRVSKRRLGRV